MDVNDTTLCRTVQTEVEVGSEFCFASETELLFRGRSPSSKYWAVWVIDPTHPDVRPRVVAEFPGDVTDLALSISGVLVLKVKLLSTRGLDEARSVARQREEIGTSGILHESFPVRAWDRDLGPHRSTLVRVEDWRVGSGAAVLTRDIDRQLDGHSFDLSPDGTLVATGWHLFDTTPGARRSAVVLVDAGGSRRFVADERDVHFERPRFSPNGRWLLCERVEMPTQTEPPNHSLWLIDLETGAGRSVAAELDLWPIAPRWSADSATIYFVAEERGRRPVFCVDLDADDTILRLTNDDNCYTELAVAPVDELWALRSSLAQPPSLAALDTSTLGTVDKPHRSQPVMDLPGTISEVTVLANDAQGLRGWLLLPAGASPAKPAPLLLLVHGGPEQSWLDWAPWGYNPWIFVEQGYAVLLPDPALSTGYGQEFIRRGWSGWGDKAYSDLMTFIDSIAERPDIDSARMGVVGHSFGGYMANWIAGHTDRFRAIVSHAGLWDLPNYGGTTDRPHHWVRQFGNPDNDATRYVENSPERFKDEIRTPMLLVHGDRDYRVPVSESIRLWRDLNERGVPGKFLYFPDENHYVLRPGNVRTWYATMLSFLAENVLERPFERPEGI